MRIANVLHLGVKELRSLLRDPGMLVLILYAFTLAIYVGATAIPETLHKAPIAIVDEDRSPLSQRIIAAFYPPQFMPPVIIDHTAMDARMDAGLDTFALNIPPNFQQDLLAGRQPVIQLNIDATRMSQAFTGNGHVQAIVQREISDHLRTPATSDGNAVTLALRARFNPELNNAWFGGVMKLIDNVTLLSIILTGAALLREREHGTIEHLLVMPVTPFEIMAAKIWAMALVVLLATTGSLVIIMEGLLAMPIEGSKTLFLAGTALHLFATTALGILIATLARSMPQFALLMMLILLPLQILSGGTTPRESMPELVRLIMLAAPNTHFVILAQSILYRGAGIDIVWPQLLALFIIGLLFFSYSLARFRKTLSQLS